MRTTKGLIGAGVLFLPLLAACGDDSSAAAGPPGGDDAVAAGDGGPPPDDAAAAADEGPAEDAAAPDAEPPPPACETHADCAGDPAGPACDATAGACVPLPAGHPLGWGDGSPGSVTLTEIYRPQVAAEAPDLAFHPTRDELWIVNRFYESPGVCSPSNPGSARCISLGGFTTVLFRPGAPTQEVALLQDGNAWHFMRRPPSLAMGAADTFATCAEAATGNFEDDAAMFVGPTLWSSNLAIYAQPSGGNGSHLDMLHASPWCMGIAHERDNVYWVFNGHAGSLDRYDFHEDHGPGADDHSDGEIHRYAAGKLLRVPNVPSHLAFDASTGHLYVADTGNARVVRLDTLSGTPGLPFSPVYEPLADWGYVNGASLSEVVPAGTLTQPSGLALHDGLLYVSDHATGRFHAFDLDGNEVRTLDTGLPPGALAGLEIGPDGRVWFTDMQEGVVYRIDP